MPDDATNAVAPAQGAFRIWPADAAGKLIDPPDVAKGVPDHGPNPADDKAIEIFFGVLDSVALPSTEQVALQIEIDKVLRIVRRLYLDGDTPRRETFRIYYVRLFHVAQVGLEGPRAAPEVARGGLAAISTDLVEDEAGRVKNAHLRTLGMHAVRYSLPFLLLYALACVTATTGLARYLRVLHIDAAWLANFSLLWVGCFHGVWLSYGIRKNRIGLADLVNPDEDRLVPQIRLLFAGLLTLAAGLTIALGIVDLRLGPVSLADITREPALAYLVGLFFGIGELVLPASIGGRATSLAAVTK